MSKPTLALEQAQDLSITAGSPQQVYEAVTAGAGLSLYMTTKWYEETLHFEEVYVGEDGYFAGIRTDHFANAGGLGLHDQPFVCFFRYDMSGAFALVKWFFDGNTEDVSQAYPYGIYRWFVGDPWQTVYAHDETGAPTLGSLDALMDAVRDGRQMRVAIRNLFNFDDGQPAGPDHWVIVNISQPCIAEGHAAGLTETILLMTGSRPLMFTRPYFPGYALLRTTGVADMQLSSPEIRFGRMKLNRAMKWLIRR